MMRSIRGLNISASDGDIGDVQDVYFEDESWTVRYLVADTGGSLSGRRVLISPLSLRLKEHDPSHLFVNLTKTEVRDSPDVNSALPVSRQHEGPFSRYYGYTPYREGPYRWGGDALTGFWPDGGNWSEWNARSQPG